MERRFVDCIDVMFREGTGVEAGEKKENKECQGKGSAGLGPCSQNPEALDKVFEGRASAGHEQPVSSCQKGPR